MEHLCRQDLYESLHETWHVIYIAVLYVDYMTTFTSIGFQFYWLYLM